VVQIYSWSEIDLVSGSGISSLGAIERLSRGTAQQALVVATEENLEPRLLQSLQERVALFQSGKPYLPAELEQFRRERIQKP
jgi:hypothetical protein